MSKMEHQDWSEAAQRLAAIIDTAIDGIITINDRGIVDTINPAAARLFGYAPEEVIGQNVNMLMPRPYHKKHDGYLDNYHRTGQAQIIGIGREVEGLKKDGSIFPLRLAVSQMIIDGERRYTGIIHDMSDIKAAEAKILELNRRLEEKVADRTEELANAVNRLLGTNRQLSREIEERHAIEQELRDREVKLEQSLTKEKELNTLKTRFVSMASHEFRTPLSTILSSAELVEMYETAEQQDKRLRHLRRIKSAVNNLNDVLNDFLSLSRLEEGRMPSQMEIFHLETFCQDMHEEVNPLLKKGQELFLITENIDRDIFLDKKFLRNIMLNLLSNAIKYSPEGAAIHCSAKMASGDDVLQIQIKDEGIGIPEQDQAHLFTRFFRAHNVENVKGTGLGLHIVKRYVDLLEGTIDFTSELGKGSVFTITLPIKQQP